MSSFSQNEEFTLKGAIFEAYTKVSLLGCKVEILSGTDSMTIASTTATQKFRSGSDIFYTSDYSLVIPKKEGDYFLRVSKKGYETICQPFSLRNLYKREFSRAIPDVYMEKESLVNLDEIVITATKVKFYLDGDTIVYNADAFQLAEGSMLDALIRQLPGVELKGDKIYVNGRFVESLLLNGKDFFKGNNGVLLNNLPNYMVKNVAVYEKQGDDSEFLGHEVANDTRYVMDVKLKKQYSTGGLGNVELGGGSEEKYLARLFAMRFTNHSRLSVYFNANNLNDFGKPGEHTNWSPTKMSTGISTQQIGGLDYNIEDKNKKYKVGGNFQVSNTNNDIKSSTFQTMFLAGGDQYKRIRLYEHKKNLSLTTKHRFYFEWNNANLELSPEASYNRNNIFRDDALATFIQNLSESDLKSESSFFGEYVADAYRSFVINRNMRQKKERGNEWHTGITAKSRIKFNRIPDNLTLYAHGDYYNSTSEKFEHNLIEYYANGKLTSIDYKNRYFDAKPNHGYNLNSKITYSYIIKRGLMLDLSYSFERNYTNTWSDLYLLNNLEGWGKGTEHELGLLPSYGEYLKTVDISNSYKSKQTTNASALEAFLVWRKETNKSTWKGQLAIPVSLQNRKLSYERNNTDTTYSKRNVLLNVYSTYVDWASKNRKYNFKLQYALSTKTPDMNMYLHLYDTTDPLNVTVGNSNLKSSLSHQIITTFIRMYPQKRIMWAVEGVFQPTQNAISMGYVYDKSTGVKTYRPDNINGCWRGNVNIGMSGPIDKRKKLNIKLMIGTSYVHNVDLISVKDRVSSSRSVVDTYSLMESLQLDYTIGKSQVGLISDCTWMRSNSDRKDFIPMNATEMKNGITAQITLPWHFSLGTDLTLYSRHGYAYKDMNTTDFVWNARLTRPLLKEKLLIQLDGYDILKQMNNTKRTLNAQGIVETHTNAISQYVLLHLTYYLNIKPKTRK